MNTNDIDSYYLGIADCIDDGKAENFKYDLLKIISYLHDISTGVGGDPNYDTFRRARWLKWKLSVWEEEKSLGHNLCPGNNPKYDECVRQLALSALDEFEKRCCFGIYKNALIENES